MHRLVVTLLTLPLLLIAAWGQEPSATGPAAVKKDTSDQSQQVSVKHLPWNLLSDQAAIWGSPTHIRTSDLNWLVPFGLVTGSMIATDRWVPGTLDLSANTNQQFNRLSNVGLGALTAMSGGMFLLGHMRHDEHQRIAGLLAGEAMIDSLAVGQTLKFAFGRERPGEGSMRNEFWQGGNSFPSSHAILSWSSAAALTEAYPGWGSKMLFYGGATAVSVSRILANKHAPSDVLVGSTLGYLIGKKVYRRHAAELEIEKQYGTFKASPDVDSPSLHSRASAYVPMDSWVYPAFDRLIALGFVNSGIVGLRPWTRSECERLLDEIPTDAEPDDPIAKPLIGALRSEFSTRESPDYQGLSAEVESVYVRAQGISGQPLTDDFNFGGTIVNDFGRPFQRGFSAITGTSAHAELGALVFYIRAEYQHAPGAPPLPESARIAIGHGIQNGVDPNLPVPPPLPVPQINRIRLLDSYVAWKFSKWQLSFGKQSLWWGPGQMGPLLMSDNVDPIPMIRLNRVEPFQLPGIFRYLGAIRTELFVGRLSGHYFVNNASTTAIGNFLQPLSDQPYIMGQKFSLKITPNLEIGVSRTGLFGGPGFPVTPGRLRYVFLSAATSNAAAKDPGDRRTGFDFSYRVPKLRKWLVIYADSMAEDEYNPIAYPRRSAMNPGIYLPQIPKLRHLDFRAEAAYTDLPGLKPVDYYYWNLRYLNGYTNAGHIIGDWVGRQGKALQFSSRYWFSAQNKVEVTYRKLGVSPQTGRRGTQQSLRVSADWKLSPTLQASTWVQHEKWNFTVLAPGPQSNTSASLQLTYTPNWRFHH